MSQVGQTGGNTEYVQSQQVVYGNPTTTYQTVGNTYNSNLYQTGYVNTGASQTVYQQAPQVVNTVVSTGKEVIKGESRIEYVPFEKKIIEYRDEVRVERVPKTRKVTEYRE